MRVILSSVKRVRSRVAYIVSGGVILSSVKRRHRRVAYTVSGWVSLYSIVRMRSIAFILFHRAFFWHSWASLLLKVTSVKR